MSLFDWIMPFWRPRPASPPVGHYGTYPGNENTLLGRCMRAYNEAPGPCLATSRGISLVLEHLAAEIMAQQHMRGSMDAHEVARMLLEGARPQRIQIEWKECRREA